MSSVTTCQVAATCETAIAVSAAPAVTTSAVTATSALSTAATVSTAATASAMPPATRATATPAAGGTAAAARHRSSDETNQGESGNECDEAGAHGNVSGLRRTGPRGRSAGCASIRTLAPQGARVING